MSGNKRNRILMDIIEAYWEDGKDVKTIYIPQEWYDRLPKRYQKYNGYMEEGAYGIYNVFISKNFRVVCR